MLAGASFGVIIYPYSVLDSAGERSGSAGLRHRWPWRGSSLMRNCVLILAISAALDFGSSSLLGAPGSLIGPEQLSQLIRQLGSTRFKEREAAFAAASVSDP